jgi:hypothetical protein
MTEELQLLEGAAGVGEGWPRWEGERLVHAQLPRELGPSEGCEHGVPWDVACRFCELRLGPCEG